MMTKRARHKNIWFLIFQHKVWYDLCFFIETNHFTIKIADDKEESTFKFTKFSGYKLVDDKVKLRSKEQLKIKGKVQKIPNRVYHAGMGGRNIRNTIAAVA